MRFVIDTEDVDQISFALTEKDKADTVKNINQFCVALSGLVVTFTGKLTTNEQEAKGIKEFILTNAASLADGMIGAGALTVDEHFIATMLDRTEKATAHVEKAAAEEPEEET